ncbi:pyridoxal-phosphate dependent enzyme [Candidatus Bathyarchaeota archaeon]|nr:pyridoxal-phosphate dependent enzyme [Candidatus Bathyarchaeota archaeon]NIR16416.1 pyridoxal-phosphate dependent enzyme [Desulfobacterales bacterium]NIU81517.1 pyridoxal-phosphate dependent enzyme [Candidatus Bathyarchaeota archaeon]NIV68163.1 pyridoxal-phosphate dependent enzyme [Candidatus Bathyarchaeota archaeon]NIW16538.1 pyridoxal-phosphate dependent enzyme [Candidatus Bathyarchaeota archaeon]
MFKELEMAYERIRDTVNRTPVMTSSTLNQMTDGKCFLKCENFQKTGAFKFRGAFNALVQLSPEQQRKGVITHSSGNHAQAVALAARLQGIKATVVMPKNASLAKVAATKGYGAKIVFCTSNPPDREKTARSLIERYGYTFIPPYDDRNVIAGAGTVAYEVVQEVGELDYVFCPVGGGGLLSGTAVATKGLLPTSQVIGVEPKKADDAYRSLRAGKIIPVENPNTIADGLRTSLGNITFQIIREKADQIITVSEEQIVDAMQFVWERMKLVVEPSGAVSLAGVLSEQIDLQSKRIGIIVSGGNIDLTDFFTSIRQGVGPSG